MDSAKLVNPAKPGLVIMAAGLGSRYGGLKQIDPIGPKGEILLEFAIKDAQKFGISEVVIIVSEGIKEEFETMMVPKYPDMNIQLVVQSIDNIPELSNCQTVKLSNFTRTKPWWTAHAVWCARNAISGSCVVINADDYYGADAIEKAVKFLENTNTPSDHCIVTYDLGKTLSPYGTVSRGVCHATDGKLDKIVEHTKISREEHRLIHTREDSSEVELSESSPVSMNLFGFSPKFFDTLDIECRQFFVDYGDDLKREFFLPSVVMKVIESGVWTFTALSTTSQWFGMTYPEDRAEAKEKIKKILSV